MLPDLSVLLALLLGLFSLAGVPTDPTRAVLGSLACLLVGGALSRMAAARGVRALDEGEDELLAAAALRWTVTWPFLAWLAALWWFEWGAWVHATVPRMWWMAQLVVLFLPALAVFAAGWLGRASIEIALADRRGGIAPVKRPLDGVLRSLRKNALVLVPLLVIYGFTEGIWVAGELGVPGLRTLSLWREATQLPDIVLVFGLIVLAMPFLPRIFARALRAEPLEDGPLRSKLEEAARQIGLRYRDIMVWRTDGRVFNAMVVGFTPRTRMIFMTDGILRTMPEEELLAVFFHEAGHAKKHHMALFLLLFFGFALVFYALDGPLMAMGIPPWLLVALHLLAIWFVIFGWVSRRFERESDVYGAENASILEPDAPPIHVQGLPRPLPSGSARMCRALERIRTLAGHGGGHRHGSVEDRIAFLAHYAMDPQVRSAHQRSTRTIKVAIAALLAVGVLATVLALPMEVARAEAHVTADRAERAYLEAWQTEHGPADGDAGEAARGWREAYEGWLAAAGRLEEVDEPRARHQRVRLLFNAADTALHGLHDPDLARPLFEQARDLLDTLGDTVPPSPRLRFDIEIELGRIASWRATAEPGPQGPDFGATLEHLERARALRQRAAEAARARGEDPTILGERVRLLQATYDAARGEVETARQTLSQLAQLGPPRPEHPDPRHELALDARRELARLGD